ncbi:30S ribosomal protein S12 methylthiotransferase RimO [Eubacterium xylanophilum]|uniref:30S ribosomal protein S12 methylthiotransferase RimO n=1 Tax=Eubacterium xylanophilum TaxID=39497 RepID=UPI00047B8A1A|nr:30S ribosomal protein S12 methylthiotransferase RimO [Eubacterium xylanophilum]
MNIYFVSLGCDKNLVDTEKMLFLLGESGHVIVDDPAEADVIVVNTCAFIHDAKQESIETLIELSEYKNSAKCQLVIATGCLAERYADQMSEEMPEVDIMVGTTAYDDIVDIINDHAAKSKINKKNLMYLPSKLTGRMPSGVTHTRYLKISEGCNKCCTYCSIPFMRGGYRSVPMEELLTEAASLVEDGARELILVAQETTLYGKDIYGKKSLHILIQKLSELEDLKWIRLMYCYPEEIYDELIEEMASNPKVCNYIDMPIQHCNDEILKSMGRLTHKAELLQKIQMLRDRIPDIAIRTTFITGFPGETEDQHQECVQFVKDMKFDRLGVFTYSEEEGTKAATFPDKVDEDTKKRWMDEIMKTSQENIFATNEKYLGQEFDVMIEGFIPEDNVYIGRTYKDSPDIDGMVFVRCFEDFMSGTIIKVKITSVNQYDLVGEYIEERS